MGFFSKLFGSGQRDENGRFLAPELFAQKRSQQLAMTPQTIAQLRTLGVSKTTPLRLEFFFFTNAEKKAAALANSLGNLGYTVSFGASESDDKLFVVTGWTLPIAMEDQGVLDWTAHMCNVGFEHDCEFDGWGTTPEQ